MAVAGWECDGGGVWRGVCGEGVGVTGVGQYTKMIQSSIHFTVVSQGATKASLTQASHLP